MIKVNLHTFNSIPTPEEIENAIRLDGGMEFLNNNMVYNNSWQRWCLYINFRQKS